MSNYIMWEKRKDHEKIKKEIENRVAINAEQLRITNIVLKCVEEKFNGKEITKRIAIEIKKLLPEYTVYYDKNHTMYHLKIWSNKDESLINYDHSMSILLGYTNTQYIDINKIKEYFQCYLLNESRNKALIEGLKHIKYFCDNWNEALKMLQTINEAAGKYGMEYDFEINRK